MDYFNKLAQIKYVCAMITGWDIYGIYTLYKYYKDRKK